MRQIVSEKKATTEEDCSDRGSPPCFSMSNRNLKGKALWMAPDDKQVEQAAGRFLDELIDQKAVKSDLAFQAVAASVAAGVEDDVIASIDRHEEYGVLVGATPKGVNFRPLRKLRCQNPTLGLSPSARKAAKKHSEASSNPIRVPTLPRSTVEASKYREEAIMDGVVAMVPEVTAGVSGLLTQGLGGPENVLEGEHEDDIMEDNGEDEVDEHSNSPSEFAAQLQAAGRQRSGKPEPSEAEKSAVAQRMAQQVRSTHWTSPLFLNYVLLDSVDMEPLNMEKHMPYQHYYLLGLRGVFVRCLGASTIFVAAQRSVLARY